MLGTDLSAVIRSGNTVTGVVTTSNATINTKVFIDASEYGDGLKLAGVPYRAGNSKSSALNQNACIQSITYTATIKKYSDGEMPTALSITSEPPGYTAEVDAWFKRSVTNNGSNESSKLPVNWLYHNAYRGMPNSLTTPLVSYTALDLPKITRTSLNWVNDYPAVDPDPFRSSTISTDLPVTVRYLEDATYRKQVNCEAKLRTIQFIYYVQQGLGQKDWSVAKDQGYNTAYNTTENNCPNIPASLKAIERQLPVMPYVRESRRMIGMTTLTISDLTRMDGSTLMNPNIPVSATYFPTSVAVGNYAADLHGCKSPATLENDLGETSVPTGWVFTRYQIPFNALIPQTIDGFIAAEKNISQSRLVSGSARVQPTTTAIGQAAGAIAGLAVRNGIRVRDVDPRQVAATLETVTKNNVSGPALSRFLYFDVPLTSPWYSAVEIVSAHNIMFGTGNSTFDLNSLTTRAQVVAVLEREFSWPLTYNGDRDAYQITLPRSPTFADVPTSFWGYKAIEKAVLDKITNGCAVSPQVLFCPNDTVTRAQLATFIVRASGLDLVKYGKPQNTFTDVAPTGATAWAYESVNAVVNAGIMTATNGTFNANGAVTRGDLAKVVARTISLPVKLP
ncbi:MAG: FAD-dependent oxidoreductase [Candidatus Pacebacteria bacterium]|nr:FAD-dependent oxidoreductase [Candidatus Paceibacterota bacterium]